MSDTTERTEIFAADTSVYGWADRLFAAIDTAKAMGATAFALDLSDETIEQRPTYGTDGSFGGYRPTGRTYDHRSRTVRVFATTTPDVDAIRELDGCAEETV